MGFVAHGEHLHLHHHITRRSSQSPRTEKYCGNHTHRHSYSLTKCLDNAVRVLTLPVGRMFGWNYVKDLLLWRAGFEPARLNIHRAMFSVHLTLSYVRLPIPPSLRVAATLTGSLCPLYNQCIKKFISSRSPPWS